MTGRLSTPSELWWKATH